MGSSASMQNNMAIKQTILSTCYLSQQDKIQLKTIIGSHCLLKNLSQENQIKCIDFFTKQNYKSGQYIYRQYDSRQSMYVVKQGSVQIQIDCSLIKLLTNKQYFGHQNICFNSASLESVRVSNKKTVLYAIRKQFINKLIQETMKLHLKDINQMFSKIHFFNYMTNNQRKSLVNNTIFYKYNDGQVLFEKEHQANTFYMIKKGTVTIEIQGKSNIQMRQGDYFGESAFSSLIHKETKRQRKGKAKAKGKDLQVYAIEMFEMKENLGIYIRSIFFFNVFKWSLLLDENLKKLPQIDYHFLIQLLKVRQGNKYQLLAARGSKSEYLFVPLEAEINKSKQIRLYCSKYLLKDSESLVEEQIRLTEDGFYGYALIQDFKMVILKQESQLDVQELRRITQLKQPLYKSMTLNLADISRYSKKLPSSRFSTLLVAQDSRFGNQFIVKIYSKIKNSKISERTNKKTQKQVYHQTKTLKILQNKNQSVVVLNDGSSNSQDEDRSQQIIDQSAVKKQLKIAKLLCSHFFCGFYKSQQDQTNYYLFYEYIRGVSLDDIIIKFGFLPNVMTKFYLASLATALSKLHTQRIVFRNIHPSDIIVRFNGSLCLIDYSTSKMLDDSNKTRTLIGVPYYMAPQIIKKQEYTYNCDIWSLGVVLYEMITGMLPFACRQTDPTRIFKSILEDQINYQRIKDKNAKVLIKALLEKDSQLRIKKAQQIRNFKYISDQYFQWQSFLEQKLNPPYFPNLAEHNFSTVDNSDYFDPSKVYSWDQAQFQTY